MSVEEFQASVGDLAARITSTIEDFFGEESFDRATMAEFSSQDIEQLAVEAHIFGADIDVTA